MKKEKFNDTIIFTKIPQQAILQNTLPQHQTLTPTVHIIASPVLAPPVLFLHPRPAAA